MIPVEFLLFGATLLGVAIFQRHTLPIALAGPGRRSPCTRCCWAISMARPESWVCGWHLQEEWVILTNLFALLVGFALLSRHFEQSQLPHCAAAAVAR